MIHNNKFKAIFNCIYLINCQIPMDKIFIFFKFINTTRFIYFINIENNVVVNISLAVF